MRVAALVLAALFWPAASWGQACLTYRTEDCPNKTSLKRWGGKGPDPLGKKRAVKPVAEPVKTAPAPEPPAPETNPPAEQTIQPAPQPQPIVPAPSPPVAISPAAVIPPQEPPHSRGKRWTAGWVLLGGGMAALAAGAALVAVDGRSTCGAAVPLVDCMNVLDTEKGGAALLASGGAALISGTVMLVVSGRRHAAERAAVTMAPALAPVRGGALALLGGRF